MPVRLNIGKNSLLLRPTEKWNSLGLPEEAEITVNKNYYVNVKKVIRK
jgi:hypothetical protein